MSIDTSRVATVFDDWADRGRAEGMERGHALAARAGFDALEVGPSSRYLDIGCGNGYSVRWAANLAPTVDAVGLDVSPKMIERARAQSQHLDNCRFIHGAFPSDELEAGSFDRIFSMEVFYYLPDLGGAITDAARLLAPGGRFVCIVDHYTENAASHSWGPDMGLNLHLNAEPQWATMFANAGFRDVSQMRVRAKKEPGGADDWKHTEGSLLTLGVL